MQRPLHGLAGDHDQEDAAVPARQGKSDVGAHVLLLKVYGSTDEIDRTKCFYTVRPRKSMIMQEVYGRDTLCKKRNNEKLII